MSWSSTGLIELLSLLLNEREYQDWCSGTPISLKNFFRIWWSRPPQVKMVVRETLIGNVGIFYSSTCVQVTRLPVCAALI